MRMRTPQLESEGNYASYGPFSLGGSLGFEIDKATTIVGVNTSGTTTLSVTLVDPSTIPAGRIVLVKDEGNNAATKNVAVGTLAGSIESPSTITTNGGYLRFYSNGTNKWFAC